MNTNRRRIPTRLLAFTCGLLVVGCHFDSFLTVKIDTKDAGIKISKAAETAASQPAKPDLLTTLLRSWP